MYTTNLQCKYLILKEIIFKFELKLCFMSLYSMKSFTMTNDSLVIKIVRYGTRMSLMNSLYS